MPLANQQRNAQFCCGHPSALPKDLRNGVHLDHAGGRLVGDKPARRGPRVQPLAEGGGGGQVELLRPDQLAAHDEVLLLQDGARPKDLVGRPRVTSTARPVAAAAGAAVAAALAAAGVVACGGCGGDGGWVVLVVGYHRLTNDCQQATRKTTRLSGPSRPTASSS